MHFRPYAWILDSTPSIYLDLPFWDILCQPCFSTPGNICLSHLSAHWVSFKRRTWKCSRTMCSSWPGGYRSLLARENSDSIFGWWRKCRVHICCLDKYPNYHWAKSRWTPPHTRSLPGPTFLDLHVITCILEMWILFCPGAYEV